MKGKAWAKKEKDELIKLWRENGMSQGQLGRHFGVSSNAVAGTLMRLRKSGVELERRGSNFISTGVKLTKFKRAPTPPRPAAPRAEKRVVPKSTPAFGYRPQSTEKMTKTQLRQMLEQAMLNTARMQTSE